MNKEVLNYLVQYFFKHYIMLKMYHFQTKAFGSHKASDGYIITFLALMDQFMEVAQGIYGKIDIKEFNINIQCATDETILTHLNEVIETMNTLGKRIDNITLLALRDDIVADAEQLKYLLTFK